MIFDNCSCHFPNVNINQYIHLTNTKLIYLPPNTTSKLQPLDAGIIASFKSNYKEKLSERILLNIELNLPNPYHILLYNSLILASYIWVYKITQKTIYNCFNHCGLRNNAIPIPDTRNEFHNPIPYNKQMEKQYLPNDYSIILNLD